MGQIRWTSEAHRWLREIHDYIAQDSPSAAKRVVRGIYDKAQTLSRFPEMGHVYDRSSPEPIRILLYGHYRIAYLILPNQNIEILGVFHGSLDIERFLRSDEQS